MNKDMTPAFPSQLQINQNGEVVTYGDQGMTLRDWFAGQVLASCSSDTTMSLRYEERAEFCYKQADAMIAVRNKP